MAQETLSESHRLSSGIILVSPDICQVLSLRNRRINETLHNSLHDTLQSIIKSIKNGTDNDGWRKVHLKNNQPVGHDHRYSKNFRSNVGSENDNYGQGQNYNQGRGKSYQGGGGGGGNGGNYNKHENNYGHGHGHGHSHGHGHRTNFRNNNSYTNNVHHTPIPSYSRPSSNEVQMPNTSAASATAVPVASPSQPVSSSTSVPSRHFQEQRPMKYVSRFKTNGPTQNMDATILNTIILGKLNKFCPSNYSEIKEFLEQILDSGQTDFLKSFMMLVFEKAATEKSFCRLYARLLGELSNNYKILLTEMGILYNKYCDIFEEISDDSVADYSEFLQLNIEKKYRLGYSQFLSELLPFGAVEADIFICVLNKIIQNIERLVLLENKQNIIDEYSDCLACILRAIPIKHSEEIALETVKTAMRLDKTLSRIQPFIKKNPKFISLTAKARFSLLDIIETFGNDYL